MALALTSHERIEELKQMGWEFYEGTQMAFEDDQRGVVNEQGEFFPVVPLNGWRARNLAEEVFGKREASEMRIGRAFAVAARTIQELPGWDGRNQEIVNRFEGIVLVQVVIYEAGYGQHIRIVQA